MAKQQRDRSGADRKHYYINRCVLRPGGDERQDNQ
jgi:hypothetical protein